MGKSALKIDAKSCNSGDNLYQVNGVAYIEGNLKLIHLRILIVIISHLQEPLLYKIARKKAGIVIPEKLLPQQGSLTLRGKTRTVQVKIAEFGLTPRNGGRLRQYLEELIDIPIAFPGYRKEGMIFPELVHTFPGLISNYSFPMYSRDVEITLPEPLVQRLLLTEEGYSSYSHAAAFSITNKYTVRIYWLICSWRAKGGFVITLENLRKILALGPGYDRFENITARILRPASEELASRFPIWFLFKTFGSGEDRVLVFKIKTIVSPEQIAQDSKSVRDLCWHLLHSVGASPTILDPVLPQIEHEDLKPFLSKIMDLTSYIKESHSSPQRIKDVNTYIRTALETWLSDWRLRYQNLE